MDQREDKRAEILEKAKTAAFRAEQYAHDAGSLQQGCLSVLYSMGDRDPEVLYEAMGFVRGRNDAAKVLLAGVFLFCLNRSSRESLHKEEVSGWLMDQLLRRLPELFGGLSEPEVHKLQEAVQKEWDDASAASEIISHSPGKEMC